MTDDQRDGIRVKFIRESDMIEKDLYRYTHPSGKQIDLYPDAFSSKENLVQTPGHERTHCFQLQTCGPTLDTEVGAVRERAAYLMGEMFWQYFKRNGGSW